MGRPQIATHYFYSLLLPAALTLSACAYNSHLKSPQALELMEGQGRRGVYEIDGVSINYEYSLQSEPAVAPDELDIKFSLLPSPTTKDIKVTLLLWDKQGHLLFRHLLYEIEQGVNLTGTRRELRVQGYELRYLEISRVDDTANVAEQDK